MNYLYSNLKIKKELNIQVIQIWNNDIIDDLDGVLQAIYEVAQGIRDRNSPQPPLNLRGGVPSLATI